eukprot:GHVT01069352.1.p1 GENE.GHVT01069352.1~~GHVT01069352.1.p1  ORF type:complete len:117 (-),score=40.35 GHVT01069352.1:610-960(-)
MAQTPSPISLILSSSSSSSPASSFSSSSSGLSRMFLSAAASPPPLRRPASAAPPPRSSSLSPALATALARTAVACVLALAGDGRRTRAFEEDLVRGPTGKPQYATPKSYTVTSLAR